MLFTLFQNPMFFVVWVVAILIALSTHEFSHALVGNLLGDPTAKRLGRLSLNPAAHIDPIGFIALLTVGFGWGKPVPFNPYNLRNQRWGPVLIALAGPAMNLVVALVLGLALRVALPALGDANLLVQFLYISVALNLALLFFNLLPIPPLDGSKLLLAILSGRRWAHVHSFLETQGQWLLIALVAANIVLGLNVFGGLFNLVTRVIHIIVGI